MPALRSTPVDRPRVLAVLWTVLIVAACSIPGRDLPEMDVVGLDKLVHFTLFAGLGWLWMRALHRPLKKRMWRVLTAGLAFAVLTELYQGLLPFDRIPDPYDALANALGLGTALLYFRHRTHRARRADEGASG